LNHIRLRGRFYQAPDPHPGPDRPCSTLGRR